MIGLVLAAVLTFQTGAPSGLSLPPAPAPTLSPEARQLIAPVLDGITTEQARQAALPPPADINERFLRMYRLDQQTRAAATDIDFTTLPPDQRQPAMAAMWTAIGAVDESNQKALLEMLPPEGWFYKSVYGDGPASTAFLIIQHSDVDLWRRFLPVLEPLVATGEVEGQSYGLMYDRLAVAEGRPQRYGTQMTCKGGKFVVDYDALEDPEHAEERRAAMGFHRTLKEYEALFAGYPSCEED
ncbi:DUF6624 domain-containing protein [Brevundimonas goettingensis]|jgi:hypothetical protein|uniref:Uncharacterized protein n=1 Tax=Brevundimonas goettingensis TaxID=2774190 RepID=A0A975C3L9_9CAUL|nr:DUF6624 domain-containing protein [Brevundimonas goettingensis]QTC92474.1 hypothetical protein IFJ75_06255 [Brevundimonas goettingensis]